MANAVQTLQSSLLAILRANATALTVTYPDDSTGTATINESKILDGVPSDMLKGTGFPYIIVHTPEQDTNRLTLGDSFKLKTEFSVHIEVIDRRERNVRILTDGVIDALFDAQTTTRADGFYLFGKSIRTNVNYTYLPEGAREKAVWHMDLFFTFMWSGR